MRSVCIILTGIFILLFTACKQFTDDIGEYLSYWSSEVYVTDYRIEASYQADAAGISCIPSEHDVALTFTIYNPKNFTFVMPSTAAMVGK